MKDGGDGHTSYKKHYTIQYSDNNKHHY